jgi:putative transcriptional regulator
LSFDHAEFESHIAGDVVMSDAPGDCMRKWRERIAAKQATLAKEMGISPSVLSDYESGRRSSPGVGFIRKYIEALVKLDQGRHSLLARHIEPKDKGAILSIGEFAKPVSAREVVRIVDGSVITGEEKLDTAIHGFTVLDSIKTIYALSGFDFYKIYGATSERVLIFTKVGLGRSPMVAIRVVHLKPRMVVVHGPKSIDKIAKELAMKENIILCVAGKKTEQEIIAGLLSVQQKLAQH